MDSPTNSLAQEKMAFSVKNRRDKKASSLAIDNDPKKVLSISSFSFGKWEHSQKKKKNSFLQPDWPLAFQSYAVMLKLIEEEMKLLLIFGNEEVEYVATPRSWSDFCAGLLSLEMTIDNSSDY